MSHHISNRSPYLHEPPHLRESPYLHEHHLYFNLSSFFLYFFFFLVFTVVLMNFSANFLFPILLFCSWLKWRFILPVIIYYKVRKSFSFSFSFNRWQPMRYWKFLFLQQKAMCKWTFFSPSKNNFGKFYFLFSLTDAMCSSKSVFSFFLKWQCVKWSCPFLQQMEMC